MSFLVVGGVIIPVAPGGGKVDWLDAVDRQRAFDNTYRASATGNAKREWQFSTPPVTRSAAAIYRSALSIVTSQICSGDVLDGAENLVLQSENFGTTWIADGTPTRSPAALVVGGIALDMIGDDSAAAVEGYHQIVPFATDGIKGVSVHVREITSTSAVIRLVDNSVPTNRLLATLTWSGGLPVVTITTGTDFGYERVGGSEVFRLKLGTGSSVDHTHSNEIDIFPATTAAFAVANMGILDVGGVQVENNTPPGPYVKTTTVAVNTLTPTCCTEVTGWTPVKAAGDFKYVLDFQLHEV